MAFIFDIGTQGMGLKKGETHMARLTRMVIKSVTLCQQLTVVFLTPALQQCPNDDLN